MVSCADNLTNKDGDLALKILAPERFRIYASDMRDKIGSELSDWLERFGIKSEKVDQLCENLANSGIVHIPASISFEQRLVYTKYGIVIYVVDDIFETLCLSDESKDMALAHARQVAALMRGEDVSDLGFGQADSATAVAMIASAYKLTRGVVSEARRSCDAEVVNNWLKANDIFQSKWMRELSCYADGLATASLDLYDDIKTYASGFLPVWVLCLDRQAAMTVTCEDPFLRLCSAAYLHMNDILSYFRERTELAEIPFNKIDIYIKEGKMESEAFQQCVSDFNMIMVTLITMFKYSVEEKKKPYESAMQFVVGATQYHLNIDRYGWYVANCNKGVTKNQGRREWKAVGGAI
ncbi:hypothetical protein HDE_07935 [Halotydeus destructor]|nr:hypothetical protein HDE_07935 [Halotydeus destructor]